MRDIPLVLLGVLLCALGYRNIRGNIASIHWYNRKKVSQADAPKYGRAVGTGTFLMGFSLVAAFVVKLALHNELWAYVIGVGFGIGLVLILYGQIRYNRGIF